LLEKTAQGEYRHLSAVGFYPRGQAINKKYSIINSGCQVLDLVTLLQLQRLPQLRLDLGCNEASKSAWMVMRDSPLVPRMAMHIPISLIKLTTVRLEPAAMATPTDI
jgi:hypothetical protein